jgi:hypothetical protein
MASQDYVAVLQRALLHARPSSSDSVDDDVGPPALTALRVAVKNSNGALMLPPPVLAERSLNVPPTVSRTASPTMLALEHRQGSADSDWLTQRSSGFGSSPRSSYEACGSSPQAPRSSPHQASPGSTPKASRESQMMQRTPAVNVLASPLRPDAAASAAAAAAEPPTPAPTAVAAAAAVTAAEAAAAAKAAEADAELTAAAIAVRNLLNCAVEHALDRFFTYKPASAFQAFRDILEEDQKEEEYVLDE